MPDVALPADHNARQNGRQNARPNAPKPARLPLLALLVGWVVLGAQAQMTPVPSTSTAWDRVLMEAAFSRVDANDDGALSKSEVTRLAAMAERFDALDADRDGSLSLEEFALGYSAAP